MPVRRKPAEAKETVCSNVRARRSVFGRGRDTTSGRERGRAERTDRGRVADVVTALTRSRAEEEKEKKKGLNVGRAR